MQSHCNWEISYRSSFPLFRNAYLIFDLSKENSPNVFFLLILKALHEKEMGQPFRRV